MSLLHAQNHVHARLCVHANICVHAFICVHAVQAQVEIQGVLIEH